MKVSFPHMGNTHIALAGGLRLLNADIVIPPYNTRKTLSLGGKYSPEAVCLPYKLVLGNYIEAIQTGADALLMIDSPGTCRLGEYSRTARNALRDIGYNVRFINLDLYKNRILELYRGFQEVTGSKNPVSITRAVRLTLVKIELLDDLHRAFSYYRARETRRGAAQKAYSTGLKLLDEAMTPRECGTALKKGLSLLAGIPADRDKPVINIDLTGEIFVVIDHFSNMDVENELGRMGAHVHRKINLSDWTNTFLKPRPFKLRPTHGEKVKKLAGDYLKRDVGGDALESVGDAVWAGNNHSDGVVHLLPFTCMPEIISQNILHSVSRERDIPVLSLILDEFTGRAGFITRLEAFVDLIERRKMSL